MISGHIGCNRVARRTGTATDIKGHLRSPQELLEASGYASRRSDFGDLLRILEGNIVSSLNVSEDREAICGGVAESPS